MGEPVVPEVGGVGEPPVGLVVAGRRGVLGPAERDEGGVALAQSGSCPGAAALEAQAQVGGEAQLEVIALRGGDPYAVTVVAVLPGDRSGAVIELGLALDVHLDLAVDAAHRSQQDVVGVVVGGGSPVGVGALGLVVPGPDQEGVLADHPAGAGAPGGLEDHRSRHVALAGGNALVGR